MLGASIREAQVEQLFADLNTMRRPGASDDDTRFHDWILVRRKGVELGFTDSCYHWAEPRDRWGRGQWLLTQAYFYRGFNDVQPFKGALPHGLHFSDDPATVRSRLSQFESTRHSYLTDTWDVEGYRLTVKYSPDRRSVERIACRMLPAQLKASTSSKLPELGAMIDSLGESIQSSGFATSWRIDLSAQQADEAIEDDLLDLGASIGTEMSLAGGRVRSIILHRDRDADAVQWTGDLPSGLTFDDSPELMLSKLGVPPVQHANSELTGHAVWHFEDYTLQVLYSHVDNRILRVMLIAPGTWKCIEED